MQPATQAWGFAAVRLLGTVVIGGGAGWLFGNPFGGRAPPPAPPPPPGIAHPPRPPRWGRPPRHPHPPRHRGGLLPVAAGRPLWGRAAAAAGERRVAADASRGGAARFRGERLARVAFPPHRDFRLPGEPRPGRGARTGYARAGRRDAPPGGAHDRHHPRSARAVTARGERRDRRR